ncbi:MAG TPA: beta-galactosidase GalA [Candidatus Acidoferrum sp.]|nr:beta-galactosidase GalA [Candidatus Acidoferrum sp.]
MSRCSYAAAIGLVCCLSAAAEGSEAPAQPTAPRQRTLLDADWRFHRGEVSPRNQVVSASYDDRQWQRVNLPHDYVLDGIYDPTNEQKHGYLPVEVGWYRKHLSVPETARGRILRLDFEGVFRDSEVWLNGQWLGRHPGGYTPFSYDITRVAQPGADNLLAVRVDPRVFEGHWYEGGGIYRHVYLTALAPVHVARWGTYVVAQVPHGEEGADAEADLTIQTVVENNGAAMAGCEVVSEIIEPDGRAVQSLKASASVAADARREVVQQTRIEHPRLWSLQSPNLYTLRTTLLQQGKPADVTTTTFGVRTIHFDADKGFFLNGQHVRIQGVANHQDFPAVGIAVPDSLQPWRVAQLKKMGCNGWRTAHNPPNETVLEACDRLGMLVMDENRHLGDSYLSHSPPGTTATNLSDLATMIQRDRNHPSVIMWSLCNEEGLRGKPAGARLFAAMKEMVYRFDRTRPITCAINAHWITNGISDEDLLGVNYHFREYDAFHRANPGLPMFGSETANNKTTRGEYEGDRTNGWCSSYNLSEDGWQAVASRPFMAGSYTWTGFDYKGEPDPYGWPDVANHTGLMDSCGFPKDKYYYLQSWWSDQPMVHLMPMSWNWPGQEGQAIRVIAFSNAKQVELFLNGKSLGIQTMPQDGHLEWQVPYQPGRLEAKGCTNGRLLASDQLETTGPPVSLQLSLERKVLQADGQDAVVVPVSILDAKGRLVPYATNRVAFKLSGGGRILGVGNGNPSDHDPDRAAQRNAFHGRCMVLIQAGSRPGTLELAADSPGLKAARMSLAQEGAQ